MMNLGVDLVANKTGLRNQVGLDGLVDTGSGDSNRSRDSMANRDNSSMGNSNWGSMGNSKWGSMGNSGKRDSMSNSSDRSSSIAQTMSSDCTSVAQTMSSDDIVSSNGTS